MTQEQSDLLMETLQMDAESPFIELQLRVKIASAFKKVKWYDQSEYFRMLNQTQLPKKEKL